MKPTREDWRDLIDTFRVVLRARTGRRIPNRVVEPVDPLVEALRWYATELGGKKARRVLAEAGL